MGMFFSSFNHLCLKHKCYGKINCAHIKDKRTNSCFHRLQKYKKDKLQYVHWAPTFLVPGPLGLPTRHHLVLQTTINVRNSHWHISSIPQFHIIPDTSLGGLVLSQDSLNKVLRSHDLFVGLFFNHFNFNCFCLKHKCFVHSKIWYMWCYHRQIGHG